jgi:hypothetical protein
MKEDMYWSRGNNQYSGDGPGSFWASRIRMRYGIISKDPDPVQDLSINQLNYYKNCYFYFFNYLLSLKLIM